MNPPNKLSSSINDGLRGTPNREIDVIFAVEVCGWERVYEADDNCPAAYRTGGRKSCLQWVGDESWPKFSEDISLVLPYLSHEKWAAGHLPNTAPHYTVSVGELHEINGKLTSVDGHSNQSFARAACIALIRLRRLERLGRGEQ